jgi:amidohydrolase
MGGEDFSYFGTVAPAVMFNLGVVPPDMDSTAVHSPTFVADEASIPIGVSLMANILMDHQMKHAKGPKRSGSIKPGAVIE